MVLELGELVPSSVEVVLLALVELVLGELIPLSVEGGGTVVAVEPLDAARPGAALATTAVKAPPRAMEPPTIQRVAVLTRRRP